MRRITRDIQPLKPDLIKEAIMATHSGLAVQLKPEDLKRCMNKWVAVKSWEDPTVVATDEIYSCAMEKAKDEGYPKAIVFFCDPTDSSIFESQSAA